MSWLISGAETMAKPFTGWLPAFFPTMRRAGRFCVPRRAPARMGNDAAEMAS